MVELLLVYPTMPESGAPLSSYRCGHEVRGWRCQEALAALRHVAARAGDDPSEVGLHSLRIGAATTLSAGGDVSQRVIRREGRWKSSESSKVYTRYKAPRIAYRYSHYAGGREGRVTEGDPERR